METETAYRARYRSMERTLARKSGKAVSVADLIDDLRERAKVLKRNSYYLYRAAIMQELRDLFTRGEIQEEAIAHLVERMTPEDGRSSIGVHVSGDRTSARSRKHVRPESFGALVTMALAKRLRTYDILGGLLENGHKIGTRPCELIGAQLVGRTLTVKCAKASSENGKGLGPFRQIGLRDAYDDRALEELRELLLLLQEDLEEVHGNRTLLVRRYGAALRKLRKDERWAKRITLKSCRSQCRANLARAGYTPRQIAAIFGHASPETSSSHYGATNKGWRPVPRYMPLIASQDSLSKVGLGARVKSKLSRNEPLTFSEARAAFRGLRRT